MNTRDNSFTAQDYNDIAMEIKQCFSDIAKNYVFQLESTNESNYHFQCRVNLKNRWRTEKLANELSSSFAKDLFYNINVSPTSNATGASFSYVMKEDTRFLGPWANKQIFLGQSILPENKLLSWHKEILDLIVNQHSRDYDYRTIYSIVDTEGHSQKTALVKYLFYHYEDRISIVDVFGSESQNSNSLVKEGAKDVYIVDLPRAFAHCDDVTWQYTKQMQILFPLIEKIKDGGPFKSTMYGECQYMIMPPPIVIVFSNWPLENYPGDNISKDRLYQMVIHKRKVHECTECTDTLKEEKENVWDF